MSAATAALDYGATPEVRYCIPLWLRDAQIKSAIERVKAGRIGRIEPAYEPRAGTAGRVAIVGYGPSLAETWEHLLGFDTIISCSGAHRFLIDRGIVPTYHVEVDPRTHKVALLGEPHPGVTYLVASACHPDYFDHLEQGGVAAERVKLWHVFESGDEGMRTLPHGEWALTGGADVGLRAIVIAAFLGYRDLHVFGLDGCEGPTGKHAGAHPNQPKASQEVDFDGRTYRTTLAMLSCAKSLPHELDMLGENVKTTFYGDGLVPHIARTRVPKPITMPKGVITGIAAAKPELISAEYAALNAQMHRENVAYGVGGEKHVETVLTLAGAIKTKNVLDYGCGKGRLAKALPFGICEYDPAIPGKDESPKPADLVVCTDVLEHIEPPMLPAVLADLARVTRQVAYLVIHTGPAAKTLPDGRNTHLIQRNAAWWTKRLRPFFTIGKQWEKGREVHVLVGPRVLTKAKKPARPAQAVA